MKRERERTRIKGQRRERDIPERTARRGFLVGRSSQSSPLLISTSGPACVPACVFVCVCVCVCVCENGHVCLCLVSAFVCFFLFNRKQADALSKSMIYSDWVFMFLLSFVISWRELLSVLSSEAREQL